MKVFEYSFGLYSRIFIIKKVNNIYSETYWKQRLNKAQLKVIYFTEQYNVALLKKDMLKTNGFKSSLNRWEEKLKKIELIISSEEKS